MIKSEIRSVVLNRLQRYDKTNKFHPRIIDAECESVLNQMYNEVFRMNPLYLQRFCKGYGYDVPLTISTEASTGIYYITLPQTMVCFPDRSSGVRRVAPATQTGLGFYPMDQREWDISLSGTLGSYVKDKIGYIVTPTRVEFYGITGAIDTSGVRMDLIIPFSKYADTDVVLYPEHTLEDGSGFIDRVVARLANKPEVDLLDDNAETTKA